MKPIQSLLPGTLLFFSFSLFLTIACSSSSSSNSGNSNPQQADRVGLPTINTALIGTGRKDVFNQGDPATDVTNFRAEILANIQGLRTAVAGIQGFPPADGAVSADAVADIACPDVLTVNFASPTIFPNGRRPDDDVIDTILGLVLDRSNGGLGIPDGIDSNDRPFLTVFPYLSDPQ